ncbi:hypothetical protein AN958_08358 [Leucoagaricus sp. SymC.cos]|nr:hypothetical protein AN958_08358 [Leucoagaricus sp. SymC.cos]
MSVLRVRQYSNVAGLGLLVYDTLLTWEGEIEFIWTNPDGLITSCYAVSRYLVLAAQIVNAVFACAIAPKQPVNCVQWIVFQVITMMVAFWNLELVMMIRVFALYERNRSLGVLLIVWFLLSRALNLWTISEALKEAKVDSFCIPLKTPESSKWFGLNVVVNLGLLWILTARKYRRAVQERWSQYPLVRLVMRENSWVFLLLTGTVVGLLSYSLNVQQIDHIALG